MCDFSNAYSRTVKDRCVVYGWHIRVIAGSSTREHGGSVFGFKSMGVYIPAEDIYVLGFTNCDCNSPTKITQDIAKIVLKAFKNKRRQGRLNTGESAVNIRAQFATLSTRGFLWRNKIY